MRGKVRVIIAKGATGISRLPTAFVSTKTTSFACRSNTQYRGRSYAASVPSDVPEASKSQKNISKAERRAMVESFVNKYRAMNGGKFPSITDTRKQVGGGYYLLRQIIQELEYKSKVSPLNSESEKMPGKLLTQENQSEVEDLSGSRITVSLEIQNDSEILSSNEIESANDISKNLELQSSASAEKSLPNDIAHPSIEDDHSGFLTTKNEVLEGDAKAVSNPFLTKEDDRKVEAQGDSVYVAPEDNDKKVEAWGDSGVVAPEGNILEGDSEEFPSLAKREGAEYKEDETTVSEVLLDVETTKSKAVLESEQHSMDTCRRQSEAELAKTSSLWRNLKSFADSIISRWRK